MPREIAYQHKKTASSARTKNTGSLQRRSESKPDKDVMLEAQTDREFRHCNNFLHTPLLAEIQPAIQRNGSNSFKYQSILMGTSYLSSKEVKGANVPLQLSRKQRDIRAAKISSGQKGGMWIPSGASDPESLVEVLVEKFKLKTFYECHKNGMTLEDVKGAIKTGVLPGRFMDDRQDREAIGLGF